MFFFGHVRLHRSIMNSEIWTEATPSTLKLFTYLIMRVNFKDVVSNGRQYKRGEIVTSYETIMSECKLSRDTVAKSLKWLKAGGYIDILDSKKAFTHIRIPNYELYQAIETEMTEHEEKRSTFRVIEGNG